MCIGKHHIRLFLLNLTAKDKVQKGRGLGQLKFWYFICLKQFTAFDYDFFGLK